MGVREDAYIAGYLAAIDQVRKELKAGSKIDDILNRLEATARQVENGIPSIPGAQPKE